LLADSERAAILAGLSDWGEEQTGQPYPLTF
jgi:hypothetical protein